MKARGVANRKRPIIYLTRTEKGPSFTLTYPLTAGIVCSTDDITTNFLYFSLFSTTFWDLMNSRPVHFLMLSSHLFFCLPCSLPPSPCLSRWFWPDLMNGRHVHTTPVCVSLRRLGGLRGIDCLLDPRYPAEKGSWSIKSKFEAFESQLWQNFSKAGWSTFGLARARRDDLELS